MEQKKRSSIAVIGIMSKYARQIMTGEKKFEFRKSPLNENLFGKKIYVYSAKEDKAIIGYFRVEENLHGTTKQILEQTGYDKRKDGHEIVEYFGENNPNCYALSIYDVTNFTEDLTLRDLRRVVPDVNMPQYMAFAREGSPLYYVITEWDKAFNEKGDLCLNPEKKKAMILEKGKEMGGRK